MRRITGPGKHCVDASSKGGDQQQATEIATRKIYEQRDENSHGSRYDYDTPPLLKEASSG